MAFTFLTQGVTNFHMVISRDDDDVIEMTSSHSGKLCPAPPPPQQNFARTPMHRGYTAEKDMMHSPCVLNQPRPMSTGTQSIRCMVTFGKCYSVSPYQFIIRYFHFHLKQGLKSYQLHQFFGQRPIAMSLGISLEFNLSLGKHFSHSYYHSYTLRNRTLWV